MTDFKRGSGCSVCRSPRVEEVDQHLSAGKPVYATVKLYGVSKGAVNRHVSNGHVKPPAAYGPEVPAGDPTTPGDLQDVDPVASLQQQLNQLSRQDLSKMSPAQIAGHHEQARRVAESLSRTRPPVDREGPATRALKAAEELLRIYGEVTERHPEVREEVRVALHEWRRLRPASEV